MKGMKEEEEVSSDEVLEEEEVVDELKSPPRLKKSMTSKKMSTHSSVVKNSPKNSDKRLRSFSRPFLSSKVTEIQEAFEVQYEQKLEEARQGLKEALTERVDSYLEYVAEEWMTENELAIEHGLKTEMTESFLSGMKGLFEEHYVTIPEDKYDVLESMVAKLDDMETKLNEQIDKNIGLNKRLAESTADSVLSVVSEGLAATQKEKLASLAESVEFESEEEYREKLETLKESYFSRTPVSTSESFPRPCLRV